MTLGHRGDAADVYIGLDLGTSGLKALALSASGAILARASAAYPTYRPVAGAYQPGPGDWLLAGEQVVARLGEAIPVGRWRAIGLSGMLPTLVTLGPDGQPTGPPSPGRTPGPTSWAMSSASAAAPPSCTG